MSGQHNSTTSKGTREHGLACGHGLTVTLGLFKDGLNSFVTVVVNTYRDMLVFDMWISFFLVYAAKKYEPLVIAIPKIPELKPLIN